MLKSFHENNFDDSFKKKIKNEFLQEQWKFNLSFKKIVKYFFLFGFYGLSRFWAESTKAGQKLEICEKNHLTTRKQNLACLTCDLS